MGRLKKAAASSESTVGVKLNPPSYLKKTKSSGKRTAVSHRKLEGTLAARGEDAKVVQSAAAKPRVPSYLKTTASAARRMQSVSKHEPVNRSDGTLRDSSDLKEGAAAGARTSVIISSTATELSQDKR